MQHNHYRLAAFDMDGTLLTSTKQISMRTREAIRKASKAGKTVVLCTGRAVAELRPYIAEGSLADIRYAILCSGSLLYDLKEMKVLARTTFTEEEGQAILSAVKGRDVPLQLMVNGESLMSRSAYDELGKYGVAVYRKLYDETATIVDDTSQLLASGKIKCEKINLWHSNINTNRLGTAKTNSGVNVSDIASTDQTSNTIAAAEREKTAAQLSGLGFMIAYAERSNYEINPPGTSKGSGLKKLCELCGIPLSETIGVGDADNDRTMLNTAGLSVAMGNASDAIKTLADVVVADNDHDGCAEVIENFLLD